MIWRSSPVCAAQAKYGATRHIWWCITGEADAERLFDISATFFSDFLSERSSSQTVSKIDHLHSHNQWHVHEVVMCTLVSCGSQDLRVTRVKFLAWKLRPSRIKVSQALRGDQFALSLTCVHLASRVQPVSGFRAGLELRRFELRLWVLGETFGSQRTCLRRNPAAFALVPDDKARDVRSWMKWVLSPLVLSLTLSPLSLFLLFSQKVIGLQARERPLHRARTWEDTER